MFDAFQEVFAEELAQADRAAEAVTQQVSRLRRMRVAASRMNCRAALALHNQLACRLGAAVSRQPVCMLYRQCAYSR
jgi:hypothetical protein